MPSITEYSLLLIPILLLIFITLLVLQQPKVIVKKEVVPLYYRYSHYPNYWDSPRVHLWPAYPSAQYPYGYGYGVGGYSGGYSGGIRTGGHGGHSRHSS